MRHAVCFVLCREKVSFAARQQRAEPCRSSTQVQLAGSHPTPREVPEEKEYLGETYSYTSVVVYSGLEAANKRQAQEEG